MAGTELDPQFQTRLKRFLHLGLEEPKYFPGCWSSHKYFELDKLNVINEALEVNNNNVEIVKIILEVYKAGWFTRYETIVFALTKCLILGGIELREEVYKVVPQVCKNSEELMLFTKFARIHKSGHGQGWCKVLRRWYNSRDPLTLVKEITRAKARHGRSHRTLLMKSHIKVEAEDVARDAVVKYGVYGYRRVRVLMSNKPEAREILEYIKIVEDMRHCEDPVHAREIARCNNLTLEHVPGHLLTSPEVWEAVLPQMPLDDLLNYLQRIHNMGFFGTSETDVDIVTLVVSMLTNKELIKKSKLTPLAVYITIMNYKKKCKPLKFAKAKVAAEKETRRRAKQMYDSTTGMWKWTVKRRNPKEIKIWGIEQPPNERIIQALNILLDETWLLTPATGARYLITLDMRSHMFKGHHFCQKYGPPKKNKKTNVATSAPTAEEATPTDPKDSKKRLLPGCFFNNNITPGHAAIILALHILKREKNAKIAVFTEEGVKIVQLEPNFNTIQETEFVLRKLDLGRVQLDAPIEWANKNKKKIDVFINMVDRTSRFLELDPSNRGGRGPGGKYGPPPPPASNLADHCPVRTLQRYRRQQGLPNSKLIMMSLASHRVRTSDGNEEGILDIVGIDEHVLKVMDAFAKAEFH